MPTLLTERLHTQQQVCDDARTSRAGKPLALVAIKSHVCDFASQSCLRATRDISDSCNTFVQSRFATYHAREYRNSPDGKVRMQESPLTWSLAEEWSRQGPVFVILEVRTCRRLGVVPAPGGSMRSAHVRPTRALDRFVAIRSSLLSLPGVREMIDSGPGFDARCLRQKEPSLDEVWRAMERQLGQASAR